MKTIIIGSQGMLGQSLAKVLSDRELLLWDKDEIDITNAGKTYSKIKNQFEPGMVVINCAAYNDVDSAEENFLVAKNINADGPANLAKVCKDLDILLVHYSTEYVFDGKKKQGYVEADKPNPISKYGWSKFEGEKEVLKKAGKHYLIRLSRLFGQPGVSTMAKKSFVDIMLDLSQEKDELKIVNEENSCPTYAPDLALRTKKMLDDNLASGIYHCVNQGACTWYGFAQEIFQQAGKNIKLIPVSGKAFTRLAKRPMYGKLISTKLEPMRPWQEALKDYLNNTNNTNDNANDTNS